MRGAGRMPFSIAAALAGIGAGAGDGLAALRSIFTPVIRMPAFGQVRTKSGKHRSSGNGSPRLRWGNNAGRNTAHCGAKQCRKYAAQKPGGDTREFNKRMAWNERNAHVLEKRALDRARAQGPLGGRNRILWGRR